MNNSDNSKEAFATRVNEVLDEMKFAKRGRAQRIKREAGFDISDRAINKWLNAEAMPDHHNIEALAKYLGVSFNWLAAGQGTKFLDAKNELKRVLEKGTVTVGSSENVQISIPIYSVYFCCGNGNGECEFEDIKGTRYFEPSFFTDRNIKPENFKLVCASSDSMQPYIKDKDEVGIDISDKEIKDGEVYAILLDGDRMFKQIFREAGGALRLHSFNASYPDRVVTAENHESLIIAGRQVYRAG